MPKAVSHGFILLLATAPAAYALGFILQFSLSYHSGDEWAPDMAGVFIKAYHHQATFADLNSQHNEHRLLLPRLLYIALNHFIHWNSRADVIAGWVEMCGVSLGILWLIRKTDPNALILGLAGKWFVCNVFIFSLAEYENWLSAWGLANALPVLLTVIAVIVAADGIRSWPRLIACALLAFGAAYSNGCGFVTWIILAILIAWSDPAHPLRAKRAFLAAWALAFALCAAAYAYHYHSPPRQNTFDPALYNKLYFFTSFLGNAFANLPYPWEITTIVMGIVFLLFLAASVAYFLFAWRSGRADECRRLIIWLALAFFSIGVAVLGAISRGGFGLSQGIVSRYVTFSILLPIALINLIPMICSHLSRHLPAHWAARAIKTPACLAVVLIVVQVLGVPGSIKDAKILRLKIAHQMAGMEMLDVLPKDDVLNTLLSQTPQLHDELIAMNEIGYLDPPLIKSTDAAQILAPSPQPPDASDGSMEGVKRTSPSDPPVAYGWAIFPSRHRTADAVFLTYTNPANRQIIFSFARLGYAKTEIADALNDNDFLYCGWGAVIPIMDDFKIMSEIPLNAWALNAETGQAYVLRGAALIKSQ